METELYLNRVLTYLRQELSPAYQDWLVVKADRLIISLPPNLPFQETYETLQPMIVSLINRIRDQQMDVHFTVKSERQERDFTVLKQVLFYS